MPLPAGDHQIARLSKADGFAQRVTAVGNAIKILAFHTSSLDCRLCHFFQDAFKRLGARIFGREDGDVSMFD